MNSSRFIRKPLAYSIVDGEVVVMDTEADEYVCFGTTGSFIWNVIEKEVTIEDISGAIASAFQVDFQTARSDCEKFIETLISRNYAIEVKI